MTNFLGGNVRWFNCFSSALSRLHQCGVFVLTLVIVFAALVALAPEGRATDRCDTSTALPNGDNIGYYSPAVTTTFGARGRIEFNDPALCVDQNGSDGLSSAWVMLQAHSVAYPDNTNRDGWAQVGYIRTGSNTPVDNNDPGIHYFGQVTQECRLTSASCNGTPFRTRFVGTPTSAVFYDVYLRSDDDRIHLYADGVNIMHVGYDTTGVWQNKWSCYYAEETFDAGDDMPGTDPDRTHFNNLKRYLGGGSTDYVQTLTRNGPELPQYHLSPLSGGDVGQYTFDVWTDR